MSSQNSRGGWTPHHPEVHGYEQPSGISNGSTDDPIEAAARNVFGHLVGDEELALEACRHLLKHPDGTLVHQRLSELALAEGVSLTENDIIGARRARLGEEAVQIVLAAAMKS